MNINGRVEKVVDAHKGAALNAKWSNDSSGFVTSNFLVYYLNKIN